MKAQGRFRYFKLNTTGEKADEILDCVRDEYTALCLYDLSQIETPSSSNFLDVTEQYAFEGFGSEERQNQFLKSRYLVKTLLAQLTKLSIKNIIFKKSPEGRPELSPNPKNINFNLSHSGGFTLVGLTLNGRVGVDLEQTTPRENWPQLSTKFCTPGELEALKKLGLQEFYTLWGKKEALIKAHGGGVFKHAKEIEFIWDGEWILSRVPANFSMAVAFELRQEPKLIVNAANVSPLTPMGF